jgi:hypothetical protein
MNSSHSEYWIVTYLCERSHDISTPNMVVNFRIIWATIILRRALFYEIKGTNQTPNPLKLNTSPLAILNLNSVNQLIFVMVKGGILFEVRTEFLNNI